MKIRLGKLPDASTIRVTIVMPAELKATIDRYAFLYSQTWAQQVDASVLIPHMLTQYLANDRAFQKSERDARQNGPPAQSFGP